MDIIVDNEHSASILFANSEDAGIVFLWEVGMHLQDYTVLKQGTL